VGCARVTKVRICTSHEYDLRLQLGSKNAQLRETGRETEGGREREMTLGMLNVRCISLAHAQLVTFVQ
jgi:hypothetical protein